MNSDLCFLIRVLCGDRLLKCALKVNRDSLPGDVAEYPMEPENRELLHSLLPEHVRSCGSIVEVEEIFDIEVKDSGR